MMRRPQAPTYDVAIIGAGLAGLTLARHLLLYTDKKIIVLDKQADPPGPSQKVGESLVQLGGYYMSKVLDLEEHLLREHYLKYNLRFHWKTDGRSNGGLEDYSKSFTRLMSDIATFQLDRNVLERHLLQINQKNPRFHFRGGVKNLEVDPDDSEDHEIRFSGGGVRCRWVVDASGRGAVLRRKFNLSRSNAIRHGATWCWVGGLVDIEKLTRRSLQEVRVDRARRKLGNFPAFLGTNHFCGDGRWFWVIPLHGKTSLGLVYDRSVIDPAEVSNARKMLDFACREWPLFARDLPGRKILDEGRFADFSYDAAQTISSSRWAMSGEAGRFSDPLYSPGSDLISIYNTLIVDAVLSDDSWELEAKCRIYETVMRVVYEAYVPSYAVSYHCLGDQEAFTLKYAWELAVYFSFYVFPFINDLFTEQEFLPFYLRKFSRLGPINARLQNFLRDYYEWKKERRGCPGEPLALDFYDLKAVKQAQELFYKVGVSLQEAKDVLSQQVEGLEEFARYIVAHVYSSVLEDQRVLLNARFITSLNLRNLRFDPEAMRHFYKTFQDEAETYRWSFDPFALEAFTSARELQPAVKA